MPDEPLIKRAVAFFDGQNLFHAAKDAFGYSFPNYDVKALAQAVCLQKRWIKVACAFPFSPTSHNTRGINGTDWIKIDRAVYSNCLDPRDYRPKPPTPPAGPS